MSRALVMGAVALSIVFGCGKKAPAEVQSLVDAQHATVSKVADDAAKACPSNKLAAPFQADPMKAPPPPPNPAKGTSLESEAKVIDVFVMCSWPDPRSPGTWAGSSLPSLKGTSHLPAKTVTMPEDMVTNTCAKDPHNCEQLIVPSRYSTNEKSADLRITRPTSDGGEAEVTVIFAP